MRFKDWIKNEVMTSTSCVAGYSRIAIPLVFRQWPPAIASDLEVGPKNGKKKKVKMQPQVKEWLSSDRHGTQGHEYPRPS